VGGAPVIRRCRFTANSAGMGGGAYFLGGTPVVTDCEFEGNLARGSGGAIATELVAGIIVRRCLISGNEGGTGGGVCLTTGPATIDDCDIVGNTASFGGGLVVMSAWDVTVARCDVSFNSAAVSGDGVYVSDALNLTLSSCDISGNGIGVFVQGTPSAPMRASMNWWGDASGPYHPALNPGGLGDQVTDHVEFVPWALWPGGETLPAGVAFRSISPNPFSSSTAIAFSLDAPAKLRLAVYDAAGRLVAVLHDGLHAAGVGDVPWNGRDARGVAASSGVYFVRAAAEGSRALSRAVLVR